MIDSVQLIETVFAFMTYLPLNTKLTSKKKNNRFGYYSAYFLSTSNCFTAVALGKHLMDLLVQMFHLPLLLFPKNCHTFYVLLPPEC